MCGGVASRVVSPPGFLPFALLCLLGLALWPQQVRAESPDDERARAHFAAGQEYFGQERYAEAAEEFDEAYQLSGRPEMLINRARSEQRAGRPDEAIVSLELLFERHPQTSYRAEAEGQLAQLRAERDARATGAEAPKQVAPPELAPAPLAPPEAKRELKLWPPRTPTLIAGSALVATVLVSAGTGWAAHAKHERLERRCRPVDQCPEGYDYQADKERGQRLSRVSTGFTFAALALAAATAVLWVYDVRAEKRRLSLGVRGSLAGAETQLRWVY